MKKIVYLLPVLVFINNCFGQASSSYREMLITQVETIGQHAGITLKESCADLIATDLMELSNSYKKNELSTEETNNLLDGYTYEAIGKMRMDSAWDSKEFGESDYVPIRSSLFRPLITLIFESEPDSANVYVDGNLLPLGNTQLKKPFDSNKSLTFVFDKDGYKSIKKNWKVSPYPPTQNIKVKLDIKK